MVEDDHRRYEEDLAAYLLDALEPDEVRAFRAHLEGCARCQADERWLSSSIEVLPSSVDQFELSPALRKRLMDRVQVEAASDKASTREKLPRRRRWTFGLRPAAAAGLATVVIAVAGVAGYLIGQDEGTGVTTTTIQAQATPEEPMARARVERTGDSAVLRVDSLPPTRAGRVYQTWLQRGKDGAIEPSTVFVVSKDGSGSAAVQGDLDGVSAVMVSEEPAGGSDQPTTKPVLIANL
jgi:anti-sigma factor RsiW